MPSVASPMPQLQGEGRQCRHAAVSIRVAGCGANVAGIAQGILARPGET